MNGKRWLALAALAALGCGKKKAEEPPKVIDAGPPPLALPTIGVDAVRRMNFVYGEGAGDYARAVAAYKTRAWADVKSACEAALKKDAAHLDAHRLLATADAQLGDKAGAQQHLAAALGGDWLKYGPGLATDKDLADFLASAEGKQVMELSARIEAETRKAIAPAALVIGRRSTFKWPAKSGWASSRGELYAFAPDGPRFVRVTHTDEQVVAWLASPSGNELAVIGYDKVELPDAKAPADAPPLLARTWIDTLDARTLAPTGKRAVLGKAREVDVYYAAGDQLVALTWTAKGRWDVGDATAYSIDRATGKATKTKAPDPVGARALVTLDDAAIDAPPAGVDAAWTGDPLAATELTLTATKKVATVPGSGKATRASVAASPKGGRLAFATWADPCATDGSLPSLYVFDGASGQLHHVLTAASRFGARWLDEDKLIYEDDEGGLRVFDAAAGHEVVHAAERGGLALRALSSTAKPICKSAPPPPPAAGATDDGSEAPPPGDAVDGGAAGAGAGAAPASAPAP